MIRHLLVFAALCAAPCAVAEEKTPAADPVSLPLFEAPRSLDNGFRMTWDQSSSLHHLLIVGANHGIHLGTWKLLGGSPFWAYFAEIGVTTAFDVLTVLGPLGEGWEHEEGHASAMAYVGMPSQQAFNPGSTCDSGSVCGMTDAQIAAVHDRRAADWGRVQEAGMETELLNVTRVERDVFFYDRPAYQHVPYLAFNVVNVVAYRQICVTPELVTTNDVMAESPDVLNRDFTGPDCTGWVFDLFRPTTPYADRGPHPLGGIRRIRLDSDLTPEEFTYLTRMRNLGFLNFVDPFLFGLSGFDVPGGFKVGGAVRHHLTDSGDLVEVTLLGRREPWKLEAALRAYSNHERVFPGLGAQLHRYPVSVGFLSAGVDLWLQPADHSFYAVDAWPGGAIRVEGALPVIPHGEAFLRLQAKTSGWVAGDAALDPALAASVGVNVVL